MPPQTIAIIRRNTSKPYSFKALYWLECLAKYNNFREIRHARNGGEMSIIANGVRYDVDGFVPPNGSERKATVFSFHGCYWHGSLECKVTKNLGTRTARDRYDATLIRDQEIRKAGYHHIVMWEHTYDNWIKNVPQFQESIRAIKRAINVKPLQCGESLMGGRTDTHVLYIPKTGVRICYVDFCSLYPYIMKISCFPIGSPKILVGSSLPKIDELTLGMNDGYFGLMYVEVLAPQDLWLPVLPVSIDKKLMFPLCFTCAVENCSEVCTHHERERMLKDVYTSPEPKLALDKGYHIRKIYEIWNFERDANLFKDYVNGYLKSKVESSGYPHNVTTDEEKEVYINRYEQKEGVKLTKDNICRNPGRRYLAKLALNSLWGKFAQSTLKGNIYLAASSSEVWHHVNDLNKEVTLVEYIGGGYIIHYDLVSSDSELSAVTNLPLASFTTAYARIQLYRIIDKLGRRTLYTDTDSVIFTAEAGEYMPPIGSFLGELTDEICDGYGADAYADSFVSLGPKTYSLRINMGDNSFKYIVKAKGIEYLPKQ